MAKPQILPGTTDRRIASLLTLLVDNATIVISGSRIAKEIGVTRSTVWRWVERLRELGVRVKGAPRTGYHLETAPDILTPDLVRRGLRGSLFSKTIHHFFKVDSTNRVALELGHAGEPEGAVVIAEEQTAGRGRAGRRWHSERATGIYLTMLLRPPISPIQAPLLPLITGLSVRAAIEVQTGVAPDLKWPNDLLLGGRKIGGILTEMHAEPGAVRFVIVGIGLNVNQTKFPEELSQLATSLRAEIGRIISRLDLVVRLLRQFENDYNRFLREGPGWVSGSFCAASSFARGKSVRVADGAESFTGTTAGLSPEGRLLVKRADGQTTAVLSGDVAEAR